MRKLLLPLALMLTVATAGEQFAMSDADKKMYEEMQENNPADIFVDAGSEELEDNLGGEEALQNFLNVSEKELPKYIAGFPRYITKLDNVVGIDQVLQAMQVEQGKKRTSLNEEPITIMSAYVKSLANDELVNIDINENKEMKASYDLGKIIYEKVRGKRGLSCKSCHSKAVKGLSLRTQTLPRFGEAGTGATWPAYRMTKSKMRTIQQRFQGCMEDSIHTVLPLGSKEMVALEVYITNESKNEKKIIAIPGLKR